MCWADELLFVSVGNRFANKHLHVSINLTYKYELNLSLLAGYVGVELYSLLSNVLTNTTNFGGGGTIPLTSPLQLLGGVSLPSPGIAAHVLSACHVMALSRRWSRGAQLFYRGFYASARPHRQAKASCSQHVRPFICYQTCGYDILKTNNRFWCQLAQVERHQPY